MDDNATNNGNKAGTGSSAQEPVCPILRAAPSREGWGSRRAPHDSHTKRDRPHSRKPITNMLLAVK